MRTPTECYASQASQRTLPVDDIAAARSFYTDFLGLTVEEFNLGWVARYRSPDGRVFVQLVTRDASAPENATISVHACRAERPGEEPLLPGLSTVHGMASWATTCCWRWSGLEPSSKVLAKVVTSVVPTVVLP